MPCPRRADVVVNATSVGFGDADALVDVDLDSLRAGLVVADVVVSPPRTALLRAAEERGARTLDGLGMLVGQGALAVRHWTGVEPDRGGHAGRRGRGRWALEQPARTRPGLRETANRALPSSASPRRSSDESAARGRRKRTR